MCQSPQFFVGAPLVLDLADADALVDKSDFLRLTRTLRNRSLQPVGVQNGSDRAMAAAAHAGLVALQGGRDAPLEPSRRAAAAAAEPAAKAAGNVLVTTPVRSGQTLVAEQGDLIVTAPVSAGAELIAHGNIHVYGPLRGRALAGVNGDAGARIFCQSLEAELLAVAGLYSPSDAFTADRWKCRVQAFLQDDALRIELLK